MRAEQGLPPGHGPERTGWALFSYEFYECVLRSGFINGTGIWVYWEGLLGPHN